MPVESPVEDSVKPKASPVESLGKKLEVVSAESLVVEDLELKASLVEKNDKVTIDERSKAVPVESSVDDSVKLKASPVESLEEKLESMFVESPVVEDLELIDPIGIGM
uniref:Uncharacterized protein n=1 Tax=Romanomermis culicivorax TaxID=13658 RepID=A0A915K1Y6_ROMCU